MDNWIKQRGEGEYLISGSMDTEELESAVASAESLFEKRLVTILRELHETASTDDIHVEALVRRRDPER